MQSSTIEFLVAFPTTVEQVTVSFPLSTTVGDAAAQVAQDHGHGGGEQASFQTRGGAHLDPSVTLANAGIAPGDLLFLAHAGGGV